MLRKLLGTLRPSSPETGAGDFLDRLLELLVQLYPPPEDDAVLGPTLVGRIWQAERGGQVPHPDDLVAFQRLRARLAASVARADALALRCLCDLPGRTAWAVARQLIGGDDLDFQLYLELEDTLHLWVQRHPAPGAADAVLGALVAYRAALAVPRPAPYEPRAVDGLVTTLLRLEAADGTHRLARGYRLLRSLVEAGDVRMLLAVAEIYAPHLAEAGQLSADQLALTLLRAPHLANLAQRTGRASWTAQPPLPRSWPTVLEAAIGRLLERAAAGDPDPRVARVLELYQDYAGFDHLLAACRALERHADEIPPSRWGEHEGPLGWAISLLFKLAPPTEEAGQRADELAALKPETVLAATLYAPAWADLLAAPLDWPGLATLARWLKRHSGPPPWTTSQRPGPDGDPHGPGAVDRTEALEAVAAMGEARARALVRDPIARNLYRDGLYYLEALLGWNAAEVEDGFHKRRKEAARALGMLPDEDDLLDRYLALRRFAREATRFGAQRRTEERLAAESGLANLAQTAGYAEPAELEWAMAVALHAGVGGQGPEIGEIADSESPTPDTQHLALASIRRRLELAMATGERFDRHTFAPALTTSAGQAMIPRLVLRCWLSNDAAPVEVLDGHTLADEPIALEQAERFQVVHPLHLAERGTLETWQRRLAVAGLIQPLNQLFRETYRPAPAERDAHRTRRLAGRDVYYGALMEQLKRRGWRAEAGGVRRGMPGHLTARLEVEGAPSLGDGAITSSGEIRFYGPPDGPRPRPLELGTVDPLHFSESLRDLDLATAAASVDRTAPPVSPEVIAARAALIRALAPDAEIDGDLARVAEHKVHLASGAVDGPDGRPIVLPELPKPDGFPYPDPEATTAAVVARVLLVRQEHAQPA